MAAQHLSRGNFGCDHFPRGLKKYCVGVDQDSPGKALAGTKDGPLADTELPTCLVWSWRQAELGVEEPPNFVRICPEGGPVD